jgi:hypothetical protein
VPSLLSGCQRMRRGWASCGSPACQWISPPLHRSDLPNPSTGISPPPRVLPPSSSLLRLFSIHNLHLSLYSRLVIRRFSLLRRSQSFSLFSLTQFEVHCHSPISQFVESSSSSLLLLGLHFIAFPKALLQPPSWELISFAGINLFCGIQALSAISSCSVFDLCSACLFVSGI